MQTVIMAGGKGTRIASVNAEVPKPMLTVCGKPILEHQIEVLKNQNLTDIILVIGHLGQVIKDYFGDGEVFGVNIMYIEEMDAMLAIFQDVTDEEAEMERQLQMRMDTVDIAQQVIDKQMTVAQEIAGLLGETTAETKVILTQLRDSMMKEADQTDSRRRKIGWK